MDVSSLPTLETSTTDASFVAAGINYSTPATYHKRVSTRSGPSWKSSVEMPLSDAILLAVKKFRVGEESAVTCAGLSLFGIDAILAVRERPDFPEPEIPEPRLSAATAPAAKDDTIIDLNLQRTRRGRKHGRNLLSIGRSRL